MSSSFLNRHLELINVIIMGISFLFIFGSFQTSAMFMTTVLNSEKKENGNFTGNGYTSLCIIYVTFAFANWVAPIFVVCLTAKYSMILSAFIYALFILSFIKPITVVLYIGSVLVGIAAAVLWTAQGNCLSINSSSETISRNTAIFWILFQMSLVVGNTIEYCLFRDTKDITDKQRIVLYTIFGVGACVGTLMMLGIRKKKVEKEDVVVTKDEENSVINTAEGDNDDNVDDGDGGDDEKLIQDGNSKSQQSFTPLQAFLQSFKLCKTKKMLLFFFIFAYTGFELTFFSGVYGTAVGQTQYFGNKAKGYIALIGLLIGIGEITSSLIMNRLSSIFKRFTPDCIVLIGLTAHIVCFFLIFLSLPFKSTKEPSSGVTFITPMPGVILLCGYLLGFGDSIFNTQIITILGDSYKGVDNPSAFALFKFIQSLASGIGFFYSEYLTLNWQLLILSITGILGTVTFLIINYDTMVQYHSKLLPNQLDVSTDPRSANQNATIDVDENDIKTD